MLNINKIEICTAAPPVGAVLDFPIQNKNYKNFDY